MSSRFIENRVVIRGAGEMASGVIRRLFMTGFEIIALEQPAPDCIRRKVCFAEAVFENEITVEEITAVSASTSQQAQELLHRKQIPIFIDPKAESLPSFKPTVLVDARMLKQNIDTKIDMAPIIIGLGPGFIAGKNCHAVIETNRGFDLGKVIYDGTPQVNTGVPAKIKGFSNERVLRASINGIFNTQSEIGDTVETGQVVGKVAESPVVSQITGVVRGLIRTGSKVKAGQKIGDIDPRNIKEYCFKISDKANAIASGVLEAIMHLEHNKNILS